MCLRLPAASSTPNQFATGWPYFFSMDGKYEAGPWTFSDAAMTLNRLDLASRTDAGRALEQTHGANPEPQLEAATEQHEDHTAT